MTIAAFATGCEQGFIYIRGEYPLAAERLQHAIDAARARGLLGADILGHGFGFDIEIRRGGGAYICGEETAIFNSIEGFRGEPRNKPPFPVQAGVFGKPTVINNVETLVNVLEILSNRRRRPTPRIGTEGSTGTAALLPVAGASLGPACTRCRSAPRCGELLDMAGGVRRRPARSRRSCSAARPGCSSGRTSSTCRSRSRAPARRRRTLGSGVIMVVRRHGGHGGTILLRIAAFFRDESCGQCVPCRVGTVRQEEALHRIASRRARGGIDGEVALLEEIGLAMKDASICGLGQTAYSAVESAHQAAATCSTRAAGPMTAPPSLGPARAASAATRRAHDRRRGGAGARRDDDPRGLPHSGASRSRRSATSRPCTR